MNAGRCEDGKREHANDQAFNRTLREVAETAQASFSSTAMLPRVALE